MQRLAELVMLVQWIHGVGYPVNLTNELIQLLVWPLLHRQNHAHSDSVWLNCCYVMSIMVVVPQVEKVLQYWGFGWRLDATEIDRLTNPVIASIAGLILVVWKRRINVGHEVPRAARCSIWS